MSAVVAEINRRFREGWADGGPISGPASAGVVLHQFDTIDGAERSIGHEEGPSWILSVERREWSDRISATLLNARSRPRGGALPLYSNVQSGIVFRPEALHILCAFSSDGSTQTRKCDPVGESEACVPGCYRKAGHPDWCEGHASDQRRDYRQHPCAWRPDQLSEMLELHVRVRESAPQTERYNEVVISAAAFRAALPGAVEAIFFVGDGSSEHCVSSNRWANTRAGGRKNHCEHYARLAHADFLAAYGVTSEQVPLLRLDLRREEDPFSAADASPVDPRLTAAGQSVGGLCMTELAASSVYAEEGSARPQLWVYEGQGNFASLQKSAPAALGTDAPSWGEQSICVSMQPRKDNRVCFDIRDASSNPKDPMGHTLLHFGCTSRITALSLGQEFEVELGGYARKGGTFATVRGRVTVAPPSPPPAPPSKARLCTNEWCDIFHSWLAGDTADADTADADTAKFMSMWGRNPWVTRGPTEAGCWEEHGGRRYFDKVLAGDGCDRNWFEGYHGEATDRPEFTAAAPALLGFDSTIWELCVEVLGMNRNGYSNEELATRCIAANRNILRVSWGWNMCQNLEWQLCAARGKLPGQQGRGIMFATAPKALSIEEWRVPNSWPCHHGCPQGKYSVGDVYYAELVVYRQICRSAPQLFEVGRGEEMQCDVDSEAFAELAELLMRSSSTA